MLVPTQAKRQRPDPVVTHVDISGLFKHPLFLTKLSKCREGLPGPAATKITDRYNITFGFISVVYWCETLNTLSGSLCYDVRILIYLINVTNS